MPQDPTYRPTDVRMKGFARRWTVQDCLAWIDQQTPAYTTETVALADAIGRVLAADIISTISVPHFARAMMDGFAVFASDTGGATTYNSQSIKVIGQSLPGNPFDGEVSPGHCIRIMTGAPMPGGADAVLPVEHTVINDDTIVIQGEVAPGKHVGIPGEDIRSGTTVLEQGRQLRPQDLGVLSSIGVSAINVVKRPRIRLIITGNELLPPGSTPNDFNITDANSPMLSALVTRDGGEVIHPGIIPDNPNSILDAYKTEAEVILVSGGSSVGQEDHAPRLLAEHGSLDIHGVAMRPSSPSGMGTFDNKLVFLLPGNPVSCLCAYDFFAARAVRILGGRPAQWPHRVLTLPLARKLVSTVGRTDYARVSIQDGLVEPIAISGASVLSSTTRADGFVIIAEDLEGFARGAEVTVYLYE
jgi:molybdopterin molybdotransferase